MTVPNLRYVQPTAIENLTLCAEREYKDWYWLGRQHETVLAQEIGLWDNAPQSLLHSAVSSMI